MIQSVIDVNLARFSSIILSLIPYANNKKLDFLINKLLPDENQNIQFLIKMEIKKLAEKSSRVIDLRMIFDNCQAVKYDNIHHYLDNTSKILFEEKTKENKGLYTISVYHEVVTSAQVRANKVSPNHTNKNTFSVDKTTPTPLVNKNRISQVDENYRSDCKAFYYPFSAMSNEGKKAVGISVTIEKINNQKVLIQTKHHLNDIEQNKLFLWIYNHHDAIEFSQELELGFVLLEQQELPNGVQYLLNFSVPLTDSQMRILFKLYLKQQRQALIGPKDRFITPLFDSISSKGYEQLYINKTHDIPLLCAKKDDEWQISLAMKTSGNSDLWRFFNDEEKNFHLTLLIARAEIQQSLTANIAIAEYLFIVRTLINDTPKYAILWHDDYLTTPENKRIFEQHFKNNDFRILKISSSPIHAEKDAYAPSALPCHVHPKMAVLNRPTPKAARDILENSQHLITLSDITSLYEILFPANKTVIAADAPPIPDHLTLGTYNKALKPKIVLAENDDVRGEDRFKLSFDIILTSKSNQAVNVSGKTVNVSTLGLLIHLDKDVSFKAGEEIELSINVPFKSNSRTIKKQPYVVLGTNANNVIRLLISDIENKHLACRAIRKYIFQHFDNLEASGLMGSNIFGLQKAMRNIYAHKHFSIPFFLKATKHQQYISAASFSENSQMNHLTYKDYSSQDILLNLLSYNKFRDSCLSIIKVLNKSVTSKSFYILVLPRDKNESGEYLFWYRDIYALKKSNLLQHFTDKLIKLGKPAVLKIELKKCNQISDMYYRDELSYLKTLNNDLADELKTQIASIIGIGEITDLTDIASHFLGMKR